MSSPSSAHSLRMRKQLEALAQQLQRCHPDRQGSGKLAEQVVRPVLSKAPGVAMSGRGRLAMGRCVPVLLFLSCDGKQEVSKALLGEYSCCTEYKQM